MTDDGPRTAEQMRAAIIEWSKQLRQQERDRKLRLGQTRPRNQREDALFAIDLLRPDLGQTSNNTNRDLPGGRSA